MSNFGHVETRVAKGSQVGLSVRRLGLAVSRLGERSRLETEWYEPFLSPFSFFLPNHPHIHSLIPVNAVNGL